MSGILGRSLSPEPGDLAWRVAFLLGLPLGATVAKWLLGDLNGFAITANVPLLVSGGLLVGFGTALGNGCTSGHGVCGLARGSQRSLIATLTFMATGAATVFVLRHVLGVE